MNDTLKTLNALLRLMIVHKVLLELVEPYAL